MATKNHNVYSVTYSPRGFCNELAIQQFEGLKSAREFRAEIDNDVNSHSIETRDKRHKMMMRYVTSTEHDFMYGPCYMIWESK